MKHRSIGGLALTLAVALGACAPGGGGQESSAPSEETQSVAPASVPAEQSAAPSEATEATPMPSYDYDY